LPEVRGYFKKNLKFFLIGTKIDLREDKEEIENAKKYNDKIVSFEEGLKFSKEINADGFFECSAKKGIGVKEIFESAIKLKFGNNGSEKKDGGCILM
jgi:GTPase SAR1 family protein